MLFYNYFRATSAKKSSELLARYCDGILRKGNKSLEGDELEAGLNNVVSVCYSKASFLS